MDGKRVAGSIVLASFLLGFMMIAGGMLLPSWGKLGLIPAHTVTVVGEAKSQEKTQIAMFNAGVNAFGDDKQVAVDEVNRKVAAIVESVKQFGVLPADIQTQNLNIYQNQESYYEDGRQKFRAGQWNVSNSVNIKLRNVDQASTLANILTKSGANSVNGPSFSFDDTSEASNALMEDALKNAGEKAAKVAAASGRKLGKVVSVVEGYSSQGGPIYFARMEGGGGGGGGDAIQSGSGTVTKSVTVTYELQ